MTFTAYIFGSVVAFGLGAILSLSACSGPSVEAYAEKKPKLDIREYLNGKLKAFGIIEDYSGEVISSFTVDMEASWEGNKGTLKEDFLFEDGKKEQRIWTINVSDDGKIVGAAHDVVGESKGKQRGNAFNMAYTLKREVNGRMLEFSMDDWMFMVDDKHLINKTRMKKFGITVAKLTIGFYKE
ncbi:MAG: DUF3833 domain-containing protein [Alphaproteobacteria bacterium]|nr:DUF3833 domain-containing protein [Alphaproteobacteria bacterium]